MTITILILDGGDEYRVPGPNCSEAQAYYTDSVDDAVGTAKAIYGDAIRIKFKKLD